MSTDSSPFISISYDGEEFPNAYEHSQMGYDPDRVFLSQDTGEVEIEPGLSVRAQDLQELFSEMMDVELVFRYQNGKATRTREDSEEGVDEFSTAPAYSFDMGDAELDPNDAWMEKLDEVAGAVGDYGVEKFRLETDGTPYQSVERLERGLQRKPLEIVLDIQGAAGVRFNWDEDLAEVEVYSDSYRINDPELHMRGLMDIPRDRMSRRVMYRVDHENIQELQQNLEDIVEDVKVTRLPERIMPPEIERQIQ